MSLNIYGDLVPPLSSLSLVDLCTREVIIAGHKTMVKVLMQNPRWSLSTDRHSKILLLCF